MRLVFCCLELDATKITLAITQIHKHLQTNIEIPLFKFLTISRLNHPGRTEG